jgi:hypothetical protein
LEGKRTWKGRPGPEGDGFDNEGLCHSGRVEIRKSLRRREARGLAEAAPVQEIAQPRPTGVNGHNTASAAAAAAQQNVELEHPPHQGRPGEPSGPDKGGLWGVGGERLGAGPPPSAASRLGRGTTAARSWARGARTPWKRSR